MSATTLVLTFAALLLVAFVYAAKVRQRPDTTSEVFRRIAAGFQTMAALMGTNLIPAVAAATKAAMEFEEERNRAQAIIGVGSDTP